MAATNSDRSGLAETYGTSLALLTDLYQLTMAQAGWRSRPAGERAVFHLSFRSHPFGGGYTVAAGLASALEWVESLRFAEDDTNYLATLRGRDGKALFDGAFLTHLKSWRQCLDIWAVPEGTVVFPHEPLVRVEGSLMECQLVETALLTLINFQTLVATKAARVCDAAGDAPVIEFGLRRAQGIDGGLSASRAAFIGGCTATSNVLAGRMFGIPVRGTHAHSWVMAFDDEREAFDAYAKSQPNNCVFLVDTYDTLRGVEHAIEVGRTLRAAGHELAGVRLDSGDLAYLSIKARELLDDAGFPRASIVASNDLDEHLIASLRQQGARIDTWGVGTRLVTGGDQAALGGVYKLGALRDPDGRWRHVIKTSDHAAKTSIPGRLAVRRFFDGDGFVADMIHDEIDEIAEIAEIDAIDECAASGPWTIVDPADSARRRTIPRATESVELLAPVMRAGRRCDDKPSLEAIRECRRIQVRSLHAGVRRLVNPHAYPAGLSESLAKRRHRMILDARRRDSNA